jgi:cytochrome b subunit of formate dehydrogenase
MNNTQKIIIEETFFLGLSIPSGLSIISDYLIPAIRESGLQGLFGSVINIFLAIMTVLLTYASYQWIINIVQNIERTERLMYHDKNRFYNFLAKIVLTFIVTFAVVLIIKSKLGL